MEFTFQIENFRENHQFNSNQEEIITDVKNLKELKKSITHDVGTVTFHEFQLRNSVAFCSTYEFNQPVKIVGAGETFNMLEMQFNLGPDIEIGVDSYVDTIPANSHNLFGYQAIKNGYISFKKGVRYNTFDIHIPLSFVEDIEYENSNIKAFIKNYKNAEFATLFPKNLPITHDLLDIIYKIINCELKGKFRSEYINAKVQELLTLQLLLSFDNNHQNEIGFHITELETKKIEFAKQHIRENLDKVITIKQLSHLCAMNQQKLKTAFKFLHGVTIFDYSHQCKMDEAKKLLLSDTPVSEVAVEIGYKSRSSFSTSFKQYFGYPPSKVINDY